MCSVHASFTKCLHRLLIGQHQSYYNHLLIYVNAKFDVTLFKYELHNIIIPRSLGYEGGRAVSEARFGEGEGPIWMDDVQCSGDEDQLTHCRHHGFGAHNCGHG